MENQVELLRSLGFRVRDLPLGVLRIVVCKFLHQKQVGTAHAFPTLLPIRKKKVRSRAHPFKYNILKQLSTFHFQLSI